jgi:DNA repair protein RadD
MSEWLDIDSASKYLGISQSNLYSLSQQGRIPANKIGKVWRFNKYELDSWIKFNKPLNEFFIQAPVNIEKNDFLRDPQREAYTAALNHYSNHKQKKTIMVLPVGCGKTGLISILPFGLSGGRILVIAPNLTIKTELEKALDISNRRFCFWYKCSILSEEQIKAGPYLAVLDSIDANIHDCDKSHIVLTNIQQLANSADKWLPQFSDDYFDMIIVDEGHHSAAPSWEKVFTKFPNAKIINLTATPFRSDRKEIEGELIYRYSFKRAMLKGYIKKLQAIYVAPDQIYFTYKDESYRHTLEEVLELKEEEWFSKGVALAPECNRHIVDASLDKLEKLRLTGTFHQVIAVACSIDHAKSIRSLYEERGYNCEVMHSQLPSAKQSEILSKLKAGLLDCIVQVQMLGEGFDHPHLSVAAIFRPFRSLSPYVQFIGRIMRVIIQNDNRHPDNAGYVVTHIGLNTDQLLDDFKDLEKEDQLYFEDLISGAEPVIPEEVIEGKARKKITSDMNVKEEIISSFFEEDFIDSDDEALLDELRAQAENLGFDADTLIENLKISKKGVKQIKSSSSFPIIPQKQRSEAKRRLSERVKSTAKVLLNRLGLESGGKELPLKIFPYTQGTNFTSAVQVINKEVNKFLGIQSGKRKTLKTEELIRGESELEVILNKLTKLCITRLNEGKK